MITCPYHLGHYTVGDYVAYWHYIPVTVLFFFGKARSKMSLETTCKQFWLLETAVLYEECTNLIENKK